MNKYGRPYELRRIKIIKSIYNRIAFEKTWKAADIGCGIGFYADIIRPLVSKIECLDISPQNIKICRSKGYDAVSHDINQGLPYEDSEFDFVNALEIIEHLENPLYFLEELKRIIKPQKYLFISTLNRISPEGWKGRIVEKIKNKKWDGWDSTHKHLFSYSEFMNILGRYFEPQKIIGYYFGCKIFKRHFPPFIWKLSSSFNILRRFGFYILVLARKR